jgi:hypothetical protein
VQREIRNVAGIGFLYPTSQATALFREGRPTHNRPKRLEQLGEPGFQKFSQFGSGLELRDGIQFLECRGKCIRQAPDGPSPEFFVLWLEVEVMHMRAKCFGASSLRSTNAS